MNKVLLTGRLTKDPEISEKYAKFTLAVERVRQSENGQSADFINCTVFGKTKDFVAGYCHKGGKFLVEGRLDVSSYNKQDGTKGYSTTVVVERMEFCDSKSSAPAPQATPAPQPQAGWIPATPQQAPAPQPQGPAGWAPTPQQAPAPQQQTWQQPAPQAAPAPQPQTGWGQAQAEGFMQVPPEDEGLPFK